MRAMIWDPLTRTYIIERSGRMINEIQLISDMKHMKEKEDLGVPCSIDNIIALVEKQPKVKDWIRFELDEDGILVSPIPDDEQEILISDGDSVWFDTFINDLGECYLDSNVELIGLAWMPLPKPYGGNEDE